MRTMDDRELLEAFARDRSEAAFGELVRRHLAWVYSVALRHLGNPALSEEVAQSVFVLLAQKAGSMRSGILLGGWLFRTTRFVANRALRAERRRKTREETAASMIPSTTYPDENEAVWRQLEPYLDQAVASLSEIDRQAVLLRFYQKKPLLEVGQRLGLSEEAAKKRVSRALEKMRDFLGRRGVTVGGTLLAGLMAEQTVQAVPAGLTASVLKTAAVGISSSGALPQLAQETLNAWRWLKFKITGGAMAVLCGLFWLGFVLAPPSPAISNSTGNKESVQPAGARPAKANAVSPEARANPMTRRKGGVLSFRVLAKDSGEPVSGAPLAVNTVSDGGWKQRFDLSTDENGDADVPYPPDTGRLDIGVVASGWVARFATWRTDSDPEIPAEYTLRVDRMTNFMGGWLRNEKGQPVANAVVEMEFGASDMAQEETPRERPGFVTPVPVTKSEQNGWWTCAVVDPNARRVPGLRARHPDFAPTKIASGSSGYREDAQSQSMKLLWDGKLVTTMTRCVALIGRIMTERGKPVGGAQIEHEPSSLEFLHTEADRLGGFLIQGLPPGSFDFIVTAPGYAQDYVKVNLREGMEPIEVRLKPGGLLRLRIVDEDGNGVANGSVSLTGPGGTYMPGMNWSAESGLDGRVEWTSAPTDQRLNVHAGHPDFGMSRPILVKADGEEHTIQLRRVFVVAGRVTDAQTGELIRGEIKSFPGYGEGENSWFRGDTRRSTDGTFQVSFKEGSFPWRFRIEAEGYSPFVSDWLRPDSSRVVDVGLQPIDPLRTARGTVWRTDGQPAGGAEVALFSPEHSASLGRAHFTQRAASDQLIVNADEAGKFAFPEEPNASFVVAVCSNGFARVPVGDLKAALQIHLQPWSRIEGSIDVSARNRPVDYVMLDDLLAMNAPGGMRLDSQEFHSKPTEEGRFHFEFVPQGLLCVWLSASHIENPQVPPSHHPHWIQATSGETSQVIIAETGYHVKGRLVLSGREGDSIKPGAYAVLESDWPSDPASSAGLSTKQWIRSFFDSGRLIIAPDGRFESRNSISPGTYRLLGRIEDITLDQYIEVPNPSGVDFSSPGDVLNAVKAPVIELGDIVVVRMESTGARQR